MQVSLRVEPLGVNFQRLFGNILSQARKMDIWMDTNQLNCLLEDKHKTYSLLLEKGYNIKYRDFAGGHNYITWRNGYRWSGDDVSTLSR